MKRTIILIALLLTACAPEPKGPHWEKKCVANPLVGGRPQGGFIPVCDHYETVWVLARHVDTVWVPAAPVRK